MTSNEGQANAQAAATVPPPKATKRAHVAPHKARVAAGKPRSRKNASSAEPRPKSQKAAKQAKPSDGARQGSKTARVLGLLRRPDGASLKELMKATGWLAHSVHEFLSGTITKRMGLNLVSAKKKDGGTPILHQRLNLPTPRTADEPNPTACRSFLSFA
jgi:hypothetical protein